MSSESPTRRPPGQKKLFGSGGWSMKQMPLPSAHAASSSETAGWLAAQPPPSRSMPPSPPVCASATAPSPGEGAEPRAEQGEVEGRRRRPLAAVDEAQPRARGGCEGGRAEALEVDERDAAAGTERARQVGEERDAIGDVLIDLADEREIDRAIGQPRL